MTRALASNNRRLLTIAGIALVTLAAASGAWTLDDATKDTKIAKLYWMAGAWRCDDKIEPVEEHWSEAKNGVMLGMCRMGASDKSVLYEIILIEDQEGAPPVMSIRHFDKGLIDRDSKVAVYRLVKSNDKEAVFEDPANSFPMRIIYRVTGNDQLLIRLEGFRKGKGVSKDIHMKRLRS